MNEYITYVWCEKMFESILHTIQSDSPHEEYHQHQVGERCRHVHHLGKICRG